MSNTILKAPCVSLSKLEELYIEMTAQNCNLSCKYCYIDFKDKKVKDYIPIEKVKQNLSMLNKEQLNYIHLTGAEPMLHPDFNHILRLCLKYSSVVIHTNALNINDKKARFLRKVEEENNLGNEIIFMISIDHYIEKENFRQLCSSFDFETSDINFKIVPLLDKNLIREISPDTDFERLNIECTNSRTLTINGVFLCPLLSTDNRGKCGSDMNDYSKKGYIETSFCSQCIAHNNYMFSFKNNQF